MSELLALRAGTRVSALARWQTDHVLDLLRQARPGLACSIATFSTEGDRTLDRPLPAIGGKGLFTAALEHGLRQGSIDIAVHSLKDLPVADPPGLTVGAIVGRADVRDVLVCRDACTLSTLPAGAVVGTSSLRRQAQLLALRPDLAVRSIRGNVETRIRKVMEGEYDATVLAAAGLTRLGLEVGRSACFLSVEEMLPAPGQGALAVQCRVDDTQTLDLLALIDNRVVREAVTAERTFLQSLGGGCAVPVAAYATAENGVWSLTGLVANPGGAPLIRVSGSGAEAEALGRALAGQATAAGAGRILDQVKPLREKRIIVTRSPEQAAEFAGRLAALGAEPLLFPVIDFEATPAAQVLPAIRALAGYDWLLFTSANAVRFFFALYDGLVEQPSLPRVAAVGEATAAKLAERGIAVDFMPAEFSGEALAAGLDDMSGRRVLLPRARIGRPQIVTLLREQGAAVDDIPLYDTVRAVPSAAALAELRRGVDIVTFTSPSSVRNFYALLEAAGIDPGAYLAVVKTVCIGPSTADQLADLGRAADLVPAEYTIGGMIEVMITDQLGQAG